MTDQSFQEGGWGDLLGRFYTDAYRAMKHDSPELSRVSMNKRIVDWLREYGGHGPILSIGAGRQSLEKQLLAFSDRNVPDGIQIVTLDIADIPSSSLLARKYGVAHVRADSLDLPYPDNSFGLVVSNHAIDFLPETVYSEVCRVLIPGGRAIFYCHHPDMIPDDLRTIKNPDVREFWGYLKGNQVLFATEVQIRDTLGRFGLVTEEVKLGNDWQNKWWEVVAYKED